jgi:tetratricopeptide (TPR) repeat protein
MKKSRVAFFMLVCASMTSIAFAQQSSELLLPGGVLPPSSAAKIEPADRLASSLRLLSQNPYDVTALTLAGESALAVGDNNAALSFLARAEEINPASGRIKAGLGSALVQLERPREALRMFQEAVALGLPVHQLAKDRGLAFDLTGEPRRAQVDYGLALEHGGDDEVVRRMALSLGISGDKDAALRKIEPLIRRNDQAAWGGCARGPSPPGYVRARHDPCHEWRYARRRADCRASGSSRYGVRSFPIHAALGGPWAS